MFGPPHLEVRRPSPTTVEFIVTTQPRRSGWTGRALVAAVIAVRILLAVSASAVLWVWFESNWGALQQWHSQQQQQDREQPWRWSTEYREYSKEYGRAYSHSGRREDLWQALALDALDLLLASSQQAIPTAASVAFSAAAAPPWIVLPLCAAALWASVARVHTSESLLVLRGLGIQTRSTGATYLGELVSGLSVVWWALAMPIALLARFFSISREDPSSSSAPSGSALFNLCLSNYDGYYGEPTPAATRFIPTEKLQDLLVNEAFRGFEVRYYLVAVVVAGRRAGVAHGGPGGGERRGGRGARSSRMSFVEGREEAEEDEDDEDSEDYGNYDSRGEKLRGGDYHGDGEYYDGDENRDPDLDPDDDDDDYESDAPGSSSGGSSEEDEAHVVVVFPRLLPGLDIVRTVWREARGCLYEPDNKG
ncbi:phosphatidylinositol n-acetylglucosaminyltransferase [Ophiostoma piceae UAMH 11346]|uniref:Phosphatidylinositol n-acetylglucosaminyltransferase n=1 Tax=Ophiostoma piceae (strain UAMH 11346) TaxID=1262450 RepID=S3C3B9_OPHP1|nr:phosphatidylinositol n-acetylglucosaminyltransferase [Ophiostoma piceae UAMH 11346]